MQVFLPNRRKYHSFRNAYSLNYGGTNEHTEIGNTSTFKWLHGANNTAGFTFTLAGWLKIANPFPATTYSLFSTFGLSTAQIGCGFWIDNQTLGRTRNLRLLICRGVGGTTVVNVGIDSAYPNDGAWHHVAVTYDQALAANNAVFYVDGASIGTGTKSASAPSTANSTAALQLGAGNNTFHLTGRMFAPVICDEVLTAGEVSTLHTAKGTDLRLASFSTKLTDAFHVPGGQGDYPTLTNYVGANNGTMANMENTDIDSDIPT